MSRLTFQMEVGSLLQPVGNVYLCICVYICTLREVQNRWEQTLKVAKSEIPLLLVHVCICIYMEIYIPSCLTRKSTPNAGCRVCMDITVLTQSRLKVWLVGSNGQMANGLPIVHRGLFPSFDVRLPVVMWSVRLLLTMLHW